MKYTTLTYGVAVLFIWGAECLSAEIIAGEGGFYDIPFAPADTVTFDAAPFNSPLGTHLVLDGIGSTSDVSGVWSLQAQGGSNITALGVAVEKSGSEVVLTGTSLEFNRDNSPSGALLGLLNTGANLNYAWSATATFAGFNYAPNTVYTLEFHVDGHNGLLQSIVGLHPAFNVQFVDQAGTPLALQGGATTLDLLGVFGSGVTSGDVTVLLNTGAVAPTGAVAVKFVGSAAVSGSAVGIGTNFATFSDLSLVAEPATTPEPSGAALVMICGICVIFRRRRLLRIA